MQVAVVIALAASNRWILAFAIAAGLVLLGGTIARDYARRVPKPAQRTKRSENRRGIRRRAGLLLAIGPLVGLALAPVVGSMALVIALGATALGVFGVIIERSPHADGLALAAVAVAALVTVVVGAELGPTGVTGLDAIAAFALIVGVTKAVDGFGNIDGLVAESAIPTTIGLFAIAGFAHQDGLASILIGTTGACVAFLAFNMRPASLFVGRAGRLLIGFVMSAGALAITSAPGPGRSLAVPLIILAAFWFDALVVVVDRLRRRHSLLEHRSDHIVHRLAALGWAPREAVAGLVVTQCILSVVALFTARGVLPLWLGIAITAVVVAVLAIEVARSRLEREQPRGLRTGIKVGVVVIVVGLVVAMAPLALAAQDTVDLMQQGRDAASKALTAARDGDTITAQGAFNEAAREFTAARDKLESPTLSGGLVVPFVASNVKAARTLADIGSDLATAGETITTAVHPEALQVVDGTLPIGEVREVGPKLEAGSAALTSALGKLDSLVDDPYLLPQVEDAVNKVHKQLAQAEGEARRAAAAAKLAPAIFGGDGPRRYLLVVQNNAESRATGGFIGSYALMTAENGKVDVGDMIRAGNWNVGVRADPNAKLEAPLDYLRRYTQFSPKTTVQNINMSPDFPSVSEALTSLSTAAGVGPVDGVMSVDPAGLAALLELSGPVNVPSWPYGEINAGNVVQVTLRDAYEKFDDQSPERADFLGDVAKAAVDQATSGTLGKPAQLAKVLGKAAHSGHLTLAFTRPEEQHLSAELGIAQEMGPVKSDAIAVTSSNAGGNKIDYYMQRTVDYRVNLKPNDAATKAVANGELVVHMKNTAPTSGLPQYVIGPFDQRFVAGEARSFVSLYSPLSFSSGTLDNKPTPVAPGRERGRNVYSLVLSQLSQSDTAMAVHLDGVVKLHHGWYSLEVRHQPTLNPDSVHLSINVPEGWKIDRAPKMQIPYSRRASLTTSGLDRTTTFRVHLVRDPDSFDLWDRLEAGR